GPTRPSAGRFHPAACRAAPEGRIRPHLLRHLGGGRAGRATSAATRCPRPPDSNATSDPCPTHRGPPSPRATRPPRGPPAAPPPPPARGAGPLPHPPRPKEVATTSEATPSAPPHASPVAPALPVPSVPPSPAARPAAGSWTVLANPTRSRDEADALVRQLRG